MSAACSGTSERHFLCSICLEVFTDPVTTPCGHNFCQSCISKHWATSVGCRCPMCNHMFGSQPLLKVNTLMREVVSQLRREAAAPGEVLCDVCIGTKEKAMKSCLDCIISYCKTHLDTHLTTSGLRRHQLVEPVKDLETRICPKHSKPLDMFCKNDQTCVCLMCSVMEHKRHKFVLLREECEEKKVKLEEIDADLQKMIQKRLEKLEEIRESLRIRKDAVDRGKAEGVEMFLALMELVQRGLDELMDTMEKQTEAEDREAEGLIKELEEEIYKLMKRSTEVKQQLSHSEDHLHLLQHFCYLKTPPATQDWTQVMVRPSSHETTVLRAVDQLEDTLRDNMIKMKMMKIKVVQQFAVDVTLDPLTAHPNLALSDDGKQVEYSHVEKNLPDNPERFYNSSCVLGKQILSSGRFYFEVQVKRKTHWTLGVVKESIDRKESFLALNPEEGYWVVELIDGDRYVAYDDPPAIRKLKGVPGKVGVFVDYQEGVVSFYDVDAASLIYSFTNCCFTHKLHPFFDPWFNFGENPSPLIICPVNQSD